MPSAERRRGHEAERVVARCLRSAGWSAWTSRNDIGVQAGHDIITTAPVRIEVKNHARLDLGTWIKQAESNAAPGAPGVVWHKRRGHADPRAWFVTMTGSAFLELLAHAKGENDAVGMGPLRDETGVGGGEQV